MNEPESLGSDAPGNDVFGAAPGKVTDEVPGVDVGNAPDVGAGEVAAAGAVAVPAVVAVAGAAAAEFWRLAKSFGVFPSPRSVALDMLLFWRMLQVFGIDCCPKSELIRNLPRKADLA